MVYVPAGEFLRGTPDEQVERILAEFPDWPPEALENERPARRIYLSAFFIDLHPVTNAEYRAFLEATNHRPPFHWNAGLWPADQADHPVVFVSQEDARAYAAWAGKRLPTEAEWEKAARGTDGRLWPWGNEWDPERCHGRERQSRGTVPVGSYPGGVSPYGCQDMAGHVWEWCADGYEASYYRTAPDRDPPGPAESRYGVLRGGGWVSTAVEVRCAARYRYVPTSRFLHFAGFRCALDAPGD